MKRLGIIYAIISALILLCCTDAFAYRERKDYFSRPQIGGWGGIITPLGPTASRVETALGGGIFARFTFPYQYLKFGVDSSYQQFKSQGVNELQFIPVYGNLLFQLPIDFPIRFQFKGGAGAGYVHIKPDNVGNWDPIFMCGFEVSFPAGRIFNIGLRMDYFYIYEGFIKGSKNGGHILNSGIQLYFNI
ncbi:MAG: hypothetical protein A2W19_11005 [Spirochaetes bacterium RBG_16_49_21]|nr:MAG: hypothetical protein A2W19_11005 [Spirochaetes bacterium RBG_16_49_21]